MSFKNYDPEIFECYCFPKEKKEDFHKHEEKDSKEYKKPEYKEPQDLDCCKRFFEYKQPEKKEPEHKDDCKEFYEFYCFWKEYYECFHKCQNKDFRIL